MIVDDGGYDRLILAGANTNNILTRWSPDGQDLSFYVNGRLDSIAVNADDEGEIEAISIDGADYSPMAFISSLNTSPVDVNIYMELSGTTTGYIGSVNTNDGNGDIIRYRLVSTSGDYSLQPFVVSDIGQIFANFTRLDQGYSEFTQLRIDAFDGVSVGEVEVTIRWAPQGAINPELRTRSPFSVDEGFVEPTQAVI